MKESNRELMLSTIYSTLFGRNHYGIGDSLVTFFKFGGVWALSRYVDRRITGLCH